MFNILKFRKQPNFIASRKKIGNGMVEEEWYTSEVALPGWWNEECHAMLEVNTFGGKGLAKYCKLCRSKLPESGCSHNLE